MIQAIPKSLRTQRESMTATCTLIAERDQIRETLLDRFNVIAFLIIALTVRYAMTNQHVSHIDGVSQPFFIPQESTERTPDLIDLSTVGF